jgi:hypothetical protein
MVLVQHNHMFETFSPVSVDKTQFESRSSLRQLPIQRSATSFCQGLVGLMRVLHAAGCQQLGNLLAKLAVTIKNRIAVRTRLRKCFSHLLHYPGAGRVFGASVIYCW